MNEKLIYLGGLYNIAFGIFHLFFWKIFHWHDDLVSLSIVNRQIVQVLNLCLTYLLFVMAYISLFHAVELLHTQLGKSLLIAMSLFWFFRMIEQVVFFGGKTKASNTFTLVFFLGGVIYLIPIL